MIPFVGYVVVEMLYHIVLDYCLPLIHYMAHLGIFIFAEENQGDNMWSFRNCCVLLLGDG